MLNIYVARHGQDEDNMKGILNGRRDKELTDLGIEQAKSLGQRIADTGIRFDKIYSSPLRRALKTAHLISSEIGGPSPIVMENLIERDFGIMTGKQCSSIISTCSPKILQSKDITYFLEPEGAETFPQLIERGRDVIEQLQKDNNDGNILIVTHGDTGMMIYAAYYDLDWKETLKKFYFGNADLLLLSENSSADNTHMFKTTNGRTVHHL